MEVLVSSSDALRNNGIQMDLVESYGHSSSVRLRALESRKQSQAETAAEAKLKKREAEFPADGESASPSIENHAPEWEASPTEAADEASDGARTNAEPLSAFEKTLQTPLSSQSEPIPVHRSSRLHQAVIPVLLSIVALGLAVAIAHVIVVRRGISAPIPLTGTQPIALGQRRAAANDVPRSVIGNTTGDVTPSTKSSDPSSRVLQAARSGDANAQLELGTAYATGRGVPEDPVAAYTWLTLAFANGNTQAQSLISKLTRRVDSAEIAQIRWNLGEMYADGIGVPRDNVTAYMWHLLAELSGETRSRAARERLRRSLTADQKSEAQARASDWLRKHHQAAKIASLPPDTN
jgi:TPR repeat protein